MSSGPMTIFETIITTFSPAWGGGGLQTGFPLSFVMRVEPPPQAYCKDI